MHQLERGLELSNDLPNGTNIHAIDLNKKIRLKSIDFLKGISMIIVIYLHTAWWLLGPKDMYVFGWCWVVLDIFGPGMYVTLSSIGVTLSVLRKKDNPNLSKHKALFDVLKRALILFIIGFPFVINLTNPHYGIFDLAYISRLYLFQLIAITQLVTYFALKLRPSYRIGLVILIVIFNNLIYTYLLNSLGAVGVTPTNFSSVDLTSVNAWIYMLFFRAAIDFEVIPWIIVPILSSIPGQYLYNYLIRKESIQNQNQGASEKNDINNGIQHELDENLNQKNQKSKFKLKIKNKQIPVQKFIFLFGLVSFSIGILIGIQIIPGYRGYGVLHWMNQGDNLNLTGLFTFLFRGTVPNLFYSCGFALILTSLSLYFIDIRKISKNTKQISVMNSLNSPKKRNPFTSELFIKRMSQLGTYSLTLFVMHQFLSFASSVSLPIYTMFLFDFSYIFINVSILLIWINRYNGKFTLEYFMKKILK